MVNKILANVIKFASGHTAELCQRGLTDLTTTVKDLVGKMSSHTEAHLEGEHLNAINGLVSVVTAQGEANRDMMMHMRRATAAMNCVADGLKIFVPDVKTTPFQTEALKLKTPFSTIPSDVSSRPSKVPSPSPYRIIRHFRKSSDHRFG